MNDRTRDKSVFVYLMNEGSDSWRPVPSMHRSGEMYVLGNVEDAASEQWEFAPDTLVKVARRTFDNGESGLVAVAKVAERSDTFTFSMLIRTAPSIDLRLSLLRELPSRLPEWVRQPEDVMFLDPYSQPAVQVDATWSDAQTALNLPIDEKTMVFVYDGPDAEPWRSVVTISEFARAAVYDLTIPASVYDIEPRDVSSVMIELHRWLESNQRNTFIVGRDAGVTGKEVAEDPDGPRQLAEQGNTEWLCCKKSEVHAFLGRFEIVAESDAAVVCRRRRRAAATA